MTIVNLSNKKLGVIPTNILDNKSIISLDLSGTLLNTVL